jgi:hypothetical protein
MMPFSACLRAGIALHTGARADALAALQSAAAEFERADMKAYAAAARDRAARLRGDAAASAEIAQAAEQLRAEDVVSPERTIEALLPGLVERGSGSAHLSIRGSSSIR